MQGSPTEFSPEITADVKNIKCNQFKYYTIKTLSVDVDLCQLLMWKPLGLLFGIRLSGETFCVTEKLSFKQQLILEAYRTDLQNAEHNPARELSVTTRDAILLFKTRGNYIEHMQKICSYLLIHHKVSIPSNFKFVPAPVKTIITGRKGGQRKTLILAFSLEQSQLDHNEKVGLTSLGVNSLLTEKLIRRKRHIPIPLTVLSKPCLSVRYLFVQAPTISLAGMKRQHIPAGASIVCQKGFLNHTQADLRELVVEYGQVTGKFYAFDTEEPTRFILRAICPLISAGVYNLQNLDIEIEEGPIALRIKLAERVFQKQIEHPLARAIYHELRKIHKQEKRDETKRKDKITRQTARQILKLKKKVEKLGKMLNELCNT
jgi:hypothetical protein